ncbi:MAG: dihydropteroate synthase [Lachnospiraceae bacterium]|nr:dihydropteroate synthase [Lachnospiraceae bacterium]
MRIGSREFKTKGRTYIMGIVNVTEDSFYDGGKNLNLREMTENVKKMISDGADIIDVGGESTRPGYVPVNEDVERVRVTKAVRAIREISDIPVSVDSMKAAVCEAALENGADLINDVWGARDDEMVSVIKRHNAPCVLMHNRDEIYEEKSPEDYLKTLEEELAGIAERAVKRGISPDRVILDPGIGFKKTVEQNLIITANLKRLCDTGYPLLLGASRKSFIGKSLDLSVTERLAPTITTSVLAAMAGCMFVRVHDVKENRLAVEMFECIRERDLDGLYKH